jgi:bacteriorhodopsin
MDKDNQLILTRDLKLEEFTKTSFKVTHILIITCLLIIIYTALFSNNKSIKPILYLEIFICGISSVIYTVLNYKLHNFGVSDKSKKETKQKKTNWNDISKTRYVGWTFTTPAMLIVLCLVLSVNSKIGFDYLTIIPIIILDWIMLYIGILGENKVIERFKAMILGFIPFVLMFLIIFIKFILPKSIAFSNFIFFSYLLLWALYGIAFIMDERYRNILMNILDFTAKGLIGIIICYFYF